MRWFRAQTSPQEACPHIIAVARSVTPRRLGKRDEQHLLAVLRITCEQIDQECVELC